MDTKYSFFKIATTTRVVPVLKDEVPVYVKLKLAGGPRRGNLIPEGNLEELVIHEVDKAISLSAVVPQRIEPGHERQMPIVGTAKEDSSGHNLNEKARGSLPDLNPIQQPDDLRNICEATDEDYASVLNASGVGIVYVTRLATPGERFHPDAVISRDKEIRAVLNHETLGKVTHEHDLPIGTEVADISDILSLKDVETSTPSWKTRIIYRGDMPLVISGKTDDGKNTYSLVAENEDVWTNTAADHCGVRILLVTALVHRMSLYTCDLASAYLQADAGGREVYIRISRALRGSLPDDIQQQMNAIEYPVVHLRRALYGRKRSGLDWSRKLHSRKLPRNLPSAHPSMVSTSILGTRRK